jgi:hypothetical protein
MNIVSFDDAALTNVGVQQYLLVITTTAQYMLGQSDTSVLAVTRSDRHYFIVVKSQIIPFSFLGSP